MRFLLFISLLFVTTVTTFSQNTLKLSDKGYFQMPGLEVTVFADIYPDGHQTGVTIIQHGERVAANGDIRLEVSPGQWSPVPKAGQKSIDQIANTISQEL
jgi:endoglucanase